MVLTSWIGCIEFSVVCICVSAICVALINREARGIEENVVKPKRGEFFEVS